MALDYTMIGKRIARRRTQLGLTQAKLSEMAEISATHMSSIERAVSIPSTEVIMRLAIALDTTPDAFPASFRPPAGGRVEERGGPAAGAGREETPSGPEFSPLAGGAGTVRT